MRELCRYRWQTPAEAKQLVFYAEHEGYYAYYEGLIAELLENRSRPLCYVTSDPADPILLSTRRGLYPFYVARLLPYYLMVVNCRVMVMTMTDLHRFHLKRSSHPVHYVYQFHSLVSTHMMYRAGAFDHYDSYLCPGPHHRRELENYLDMNRIEGRELVSSGYYRLERIHAAAKTHRRFANGTAKRPTILVAPSWGEQNLLKLHGKELVEQLLEADFRTIVRPHPETARRDFALLDDLVNAFGADPRFSLEKSVATDDSLLEADLMICDLSGVALEYALGMERPVLFIDLPPKVKNDSYAMFDTEPIELFLRERLGRLLAPSELSDVASAVRDLLSDRDRYRTELADLRESVVYNFGRSSQVEADHIVRHLDFPAGEGVSS